MSSLNLKHCRYFKNIKLMIWEMLLSDVVKYKYPVWLPKWTNIKGRFEFLWFYRYHQSFQQEGKGVFYRSWKTWWKEFFIKKLTAESVIWWKVCGSSYVTKKENHNLVAILNRLEQFKCQSLRKSDLCDHPNGQMVIFVDGFTVRKRIN